MATTAVGKATRDNRKALAGVSSAWLSTYSEEGHWCEGQGIMLWHDEACLSKVRLERAKSLSDGLTVLAPRDRKRDLDADAENDHEGIMREDKPAGQLPSRLWG